WTNPDSRHADRGNCLTAAQDQRQIFTLSSVAETPQFSKPMLRSLASGWRGFPIFKALPGSYVFVTASQDKILNGSSNQVVNQLLANPYGSKTAGSYLNPAAFAIPALGTFGNAGFGSVEGPGTWQFDLAVSRSFQFRESQRVEFRVEAFNVTNSVRFDITKL